MKPKAAISVAAKAPPTRKTRAAAASSPRAPRASDWCANRNRNPAEPALNVAAMRFVFAAVVSPGISMSHTRPSITNTGVPGGCGIPRMWAVAMNSPASQNVTVGASETT